MEPILLARHIKKRFLRPVPVDILDDLSLTLSAGESISIMGASGEGKSTLLQLLGTLDTPTSGSLEILGKRASDKSAPKLRNEHIGFIFQSYNLLADYTALHNVLMPALIAGKDISRGSASYYRALELLEHVGLKQRAHFLTKLLSGGEKQRVAIARALCNDPQIILADEPSGNLDHTTSKIIHELLLHCSQKFDKGLVVVTHDQELASLCDTQLLLKEGKLWRRTP